MNISAYLDQVRAAYESGRATEHSYRPALHALFQSIDPALTVINEPKRGDAGMVDFMFERGGIPFGWAEAKDIDKDVIKLKGYSIEQRKRYEKAYPNLIYTNGVDFEFIRDGASVHFVSIADFVMGLQPNPDRFDELERQLRLFAEAKPISITSAARLAEMMAAKAAIIKDEVAIALKDDPEFRTGLGGQYRSFKANLLPALEPDEFADIYAETITYGMFAARFHDDDLTTFSRTEAMEKLPASNPFLKGLFEYVAGPALPQRLRYIVDDLVQVMRASDPHSLFRDFGKFTARNDPFIHFYEDFLAAYNPAKRKSRGVWYTPEPVVDFIVRAVDDVLKTEFGLADGLADTSKVTVDWDTGTNNPKTGKPVTIRKDVHKVQILDPATGTGTFLAKAVQLISDRVKARAPGKWSGYVEQDLLPRLHGFELLMASYAMCHMKLDMQLTESGYKPSANPPRLSVWLTNALEPAEREVMELWFTPLAEEARGASIVKRQSPIMCVIGNPPYSGHSSNKNEWTEELIAPYRTEPGGKTPLQERSFKYINDDYVKFIRMAEHIISNNGSGIVAMITNHGYIDNPTFRGMRWRLLESFDSIYVFELNGSVKKVGAAPIVKDENVFDIQQGVAIMVGVRKRDHVPAEGIFYKSVEGSRRSKNDALYAANVKQDWAWVTPETESFLSFAPFGGSEQPMYAASPKIRDLFISSSIAMQTGADAKLVGDSATTLIKSLAIKAPQAIQMIRPLLYRPFDIRSVFYAPNGQAARLAGVETPSSYRPRFETLRHMTKLNLAILVPRQLAAEGFYHAFIAADLPEMCVISAKTKEQNVTLPLYRYAEEDAQSDAFTPKQRTLNLDPKLYAAICAAGGIDPADQAGPDDDFRAPTADARPSEVKVFDYIYGVLHAPNYRETYAEFLKIDFPRIPYPASPEVFRAVSENGEALRRLHLMEPAAIGDTPYPFMGDGDDVVAVGYPKFEAGRVQINADQYFDAVPPVAWTFHIGGYQPAQKWLKDRRGRTLSYDDIGHYQRIVKILTETDRIMGEIDLPIAENAESA
ncbi:type ISP restriction/modification enzyme [Sphingomonas sp.]|uniref:type ISP restriction/modification enzyme n=1 Tax=Sphingomonas sp. TaxID=28214 RepID=UPI002E0DCCAA|nr:type ISP restriction/modification enzyme [Sphingomonas sp.]